MRKAACALLSVLLLQGCATTPKEQTELSQQLELNRELIKILDKYSAKAVESKEMMLRHQSALVQLSSRPNDIYNMTKERLKVAQGMDKVIPLPDYQDDIEKPLRLIAELTNYDIDFASRPSHSTIWVTLSAAQRSAQDWIYDLDEQAKNRVNIEIFQNSDALASDGTAAYGEVKNGKIVVTFNSVQ